MKRFLIKLLVFVSLPLLVGATLHWMADKGLRRSCSYLYTEWNDILDSKINASLLVMGSSRAWVHVSPRVLDSCLNVNSYNLGIDGYNFMMQYCRFKLYLKYNKKPDYIIHTLETNALAKRPTLLNYQQFLPYLNEQEIRETVYRYKGLDFKDVYIPMYKYRSDLDTMWLGVKNYLGYRTACNNLKYKGFQSSDREWDSEFENFKKQNPNGVKEKLDSATVRLFKEYLGYCQSQGIELILVYPPEYIEAQKFQLNRDSIINLYNSLAGAYRFRFLDYSGDSLSYSKSFFYNSQHLNTRGVLVFNNQLVNDVRSIISKK